MPNPKKPNRKNPLAHKGYHLYAMQRSGGHGIISWMCGSFDRTFLIEFLLANTNRVVIDDVVKKNGFLYERVHSIKYADLEEFGKDKADCLIIKKERGKLSKHKRNGFKIVHKMKEALNTRKFCVDEKNIVLLRSPHNTYASIIRGNWRLAHKPELFIDRWLEFAKEYTGETNYIKDPTLILFDKWFENEEYRRDVALDLCIEYSDIGLDYFVFEKSSFNNRDYDGRASKMRVNTRWKEIVESKNTKKHVRENFFRVVKDPRIAMMTKKIFGDYPF